MLRHRLDLFISYNMKSDRFISVTYSWFSLNVSRECGRILNLLDCDVVLLVKLSWRTRIVICRLSKLLVKSRHKVGKRNQ